ncbi:MAG TPA: hypothetical protein VK449_00835, partial [Anaerolineales bacterium]|nr:hypothetical protein [Anaerolineales bacterium]
MSRWLIRIGGTLAGLGLLALAVLAPRFGLDPNNDWGPSRRLVLLIGVVCLLAAWAPDVFRSISSAARRVADRLRPTSARLWLASGLPAVYRRARESWKRSRTARRLALAAGAVRAGWARMMARSRWLSRLFGSRRAAAVTGCWLAFLLVSLTYLWFVSVGRWFSWPGTSAYHDMQAAAFLHGQTHLLIEPDAKLLALPDPYDPQARASVPHLWDASLYNGHYYLYWGPVPALLIAPVKALSGARVGDDVLVFLFLVGSLFWATRILSRTWAEHFPEVPAGLAVATVLTVGWVNPLPWMLNSPWIYESAIAGGQFFLLMGVNALIPFLDESGGRPRDLLWAGASLALAVGTRSSLAPAVVVVAAIVAYRLVRRGPFDRRKAVSLAAFAVPLVVGALALGAYNQVRFGSPTEFGQRYQLTSLDLQESEVHSASIRNLPPNLYNYLVNPVRLLRVFPYLKPHWGGTGMSVLHIHAPPGYYSRQVAGLLLVVPFSLYALAAAAGLWRRRE